MPIDPRMMQDVQEGEAGTAPDSETSDEQMLEQVRRGMGNEQGPPPGSGMKWQNLQEDQAALENDPSPENVQAFVQYWGAENLPPDIQQMVGGGGMTAPGRMPPTGG